MAPVLSPAPFPPPQQPTGTEQKGKISALPQHPYAQGGQARSQNLCQQTAHTVPRIRSRPPGGHRPENAASIQRTYGQQIKHPQRQTYPRQQIGIRAAKMPAPRRSPYGQQNAGGGSRGRTG